MPELRRLEQGGYTPSSQSVNLQRAASEQAPVSAAGESARPSSRQDHVNTSALGSANAQLLFADQGGLSHPNVQRLKKALEAANTQGLALKDLVGDLTGAEQDRVRVLLDDPATIAESLDFLMRSSELDQTASTALNFTLDKLATAVEKLNQGDRSGFLSDMQQSMQLGELNMTLLDTVSHMERAIRFDQAMQAQDARHTTPKLVNQAFKEMQSIAASGRAENAAQMEQMLVGRLQIKSDVQQRQFVTEVAKGSVDDAVDTMKRRFQTRMHNVPGYNEILQESLATAQQAHPTEQRGNRTQSPGFLGTLSIEQLQSVKNTLNQQIERLEQAPNPDQQLLNALRETVNQDLPAVVDIKQKYTQFRGMMGHHVETLTQDIQRFAREAGLELPAGLIDAFKEDPLNAKTIMQNWLAEQRVALANEPNKLHVLDSMELFSMQLEIGVGILNRVERGERIDTEMLESYERFQTFILAKNALVLAFDQAQGDRKDQIREMILHFGSSFNEWMKLDQESFRAEALTFASNFADEDTIREMTALIDGALSQMRAHNDNVSSADRNGVRITSAEVPERIPTAAITGDFSERLGHVAQRESRYYQEVYEREGDAGLSQVLKQDRELVLAALVISIAALGAAGNNGNPSLYDSSSEDSLKPLDKTITASDQVSTDAQFALIMKRLRQNLNAFSGGDQMTAALRSIISQFRADLEAVRSEKQLLQAAAKARQAVNDQIFETQRQLNENESRFHTEQLQKLDAHLKETIDALGA